MMQVHTKQLPAENLHKVHHCSNFYFSGLKQANTSKRTVQSFIKTDICLNIPILVQTGLQEQITVPENLHTFLHAPDYIVYRNEKRFACRFAERTEKHTL
jgi:hypothetical protein